MKHPFMYTPPSVRLLGRGFAVQVRGEPVIIKDHHVDAARSLCYSTSDHQYMAAIKFIGAEYDLRLKDAKDLVDLLRLNRV